ncbi:3-deoxy-D-manno-octulosonic acid transferase [Aliiglaciecola sp. CAU 1673]|uniref:3-deoxy-D-manno-octulosonic acid transferase n=1 Tax=Aliiglaciecola sp. CAU 1673 TaxID=3032595 RepID=UPI0023DB905A|nr:3-deoxy-D-manno-octulosonic acid transferase [Aliiglaciecola sp. CAU 1673]MDF2179271.1 3-deoxy-D-manno-octulosonic acid transferase [Aliiglaciecola sp. CAU 1673]
MQDVKPTPREQLSRALFTLLLLLPYTLAFMLFVGKRLFRGKQQSLRDAQRLGLWLSIERKGGLLLHCVSVGEVVAATPLIKRIMLERSELPITITTTTKTGAERVQELFGNSVQHLYLPFDLPFLMRRLMRQVDPQKVLIMEVELWPNLVHTCWERHIPIFVINARMTTKSMLRYRKLNTLVSPILNHLSGICAQGQRDFDNYLALGAPTDRLFLTNNIKFDLPKVPREPLYREFRTKFDMNGRQVLIAGSTHDPEEKILLQAFKRLKAKFPTLLLILVPRHPQRFETVGKLVESESLRLIKVSENQPCAENTDVLLADQMGLLNQLYATADIAFVGGSLAERGGHNALEPAVFGVPVLMGPSRHNNPQICQLLAETGALQLVENEQHLVEKAGRWLADGHKAHEAGNAGRQMILSSTGAIDATLERIFAQ